MRILFLVFVLILNVAVPLRASECGKGPFAKQDGEFAGAVDMQALPDFFAIEVWDQTQGDERQAALVAEQTKVLGEVGKFLVREKDLAKGMLPEYLGMHRFVIALGSTLHPLERLASIYRGQNFFVSRLGQLGTVVLRPGSKALSARYILTVLANARHLTRVDRAVARATDAAMKISDIHAQAMKKSVGDMIEPALAQAKQAAVGIRQLLEGADKSASLDVDIIDLVKVHLSVGSQEVALRERLQGKTNDQLQALLSEWLKRLEDPAFVQSFAAMVPKYVAWRSSLQRPEVIDAWGMLVVDAGAIVNVNYDNMSGFAQYFIEDSLAKKDEKESDQNLQPTVRKYWGGIVVISLPRVNVNIRILPGSLVHMALMNALADSSQTQP